MAITKATVTHGGYFQYPHMCRDAHEQIGHSDSEHERCPLCRANDRLAAAEGLLRMSLIADNSFAISAFLAPAKPQPERSCETCRHEDECDGKDPCKHTGYHDWSPKR